MRYRITVCRDCQDRNVGCHSNCERYTRQKAEVDAERIIELAERKKDYDLIGRTREGIARMKKGKKR